jgi:hypothetical protein
MEGKSLIYRGENQQDLEEAAKLVIDLVEFGMFHLSILSLFFSFYFISFFKVNLKI